MVTLNPYRTTGKDVYKIVVRAVKARKKKFPRASITGFCHDAGISKQQIMQYRNGVKPGSEGIIKVAFGLKQWGYDIDISIV